MKPRLPHLTPEQDRIWTTLFSLAVNHGATDAEADREAWDGLCEQSPELRRFDGIEP
jgi:hypothetical protein